MAAIADLLARRQDLTLVLMAGMLVMLRVLPIIFITPFMGGKLVPPETKMSISMGAAVLVFPFATEAMVGPMPLNPIAFIVLMFKELFVGFTIAFVATELFYGMEIAGRALDIMRGSNMAEVMVPELGFRASPIGDWLLQLTLIIFIALNGHRYFLFGLFESFAVVPINQMPAFMAGFDTVVDAILHYTAGLFGVAFALVFPGLFVTFMTDAVFGMLNRVAPQLNAYFMSMAIKPLAGMIMVLFALKLMMGEMGKNVERSILFVNRLIQYMGPA